MDIKIYLAGRYSRRSELCKYRDDLQKMGFTVNSRWLDGNHQISPDGTPIGDAGEKLVEEGSASCDCAAQLRQKFAEEDFNDCNDCDMLIAFSEEPRSGHSRGGRHVEFGMALCSGKTCIVVGPRENIFHWHPDVKGVFPKWEDAIRFIPELVDELKELFESCAIEAEEYEERKFKESGLGFTKCNWAMASKDKPDAGEPLLTINVTQKKGTLSLYNPDSGKFLSPNGDEISFTPTHWAYFPEGPSPSE